MHMLLLLVMFAGIFAFLLFWSLLWAGLPVERLACLSIGVMGTATGLISIGEALKPRWLQENRWNPRPGQRIIVPGRMTSLGFGIWFFAIGLVFIGASFLGEGGLSQHAFWVLLGSLGVATAFTLVGHRYDLRRAEVARAVVRRRGRHIASLREHDKLPADDVQLRETREEQRQSIQRHLTGRTTLEQIESQHRYLVGLEGGSGPPSDWPGVAEEWQAFRSAIAEGDQIWAFDTVSVRHGVASGEEGFALVRNARVVDWFTTAVVG